MTRIISSPFLPSKNTVSGMMLMVLYALIPGIIAYVAFFGWGVIVNIMIAVATALVLETLVLRLRHKPLKPYLSDYSAVLTAVLFALALPTLSPWWLIVVGMFFAIVIAKHLYGGLGYNPFNPAMVGYAILLIAFPREMTAWLPSQHGLGFMDSLNYTLFNSLPEGLAYDTLTSATPLDAVKTHLGLNHTMMEIRNDNPGLFGSLSGRGWEWINLLFMLGGIVLIYLKVINWRIPASMLGALFIMALVFTMADPDTHAGPMFHLFGGAAMLGAFFIATDPVTAATTIRGQVIYGAGIGILTYIIRSWGGYPDGIAFAVLLMNMAVPTIDYYTKPRVFGERKDG